MQRPLKVPLRKARSKHRKIDWDSLKKVNDVVLAWLGAIALLAGGAFGVIQYRGNETAGRVKEVLAFHDRFNKSPLFEVRQRLTSIQANAYKDAKDIYEKDERLIADLGKSLNALDFYAVLDFYEALDLCIRGNVCDEASAELFFGAEARRFLIAYAGFLCGEVKVRKDDSIGQGLVDFVYHYRKHLPSTVSGSTRFAPATVADVCKRF